ncbi:MAG: protein-glutamate O-methyltransferase CheR [Marinagarivorans sp.]|nr:protein-glutamate O-methyltransferase CheR [Marinagarivorans sp.]
MSQFNLGDANHGIGFSDAEYHEFRLFLQQACGIDLGPGKEYLVATRVRRILAQEHIANVTTLLTMLRSPAQRALRQEVVDAMTTNETLWFRDGYPFDYLKRTVFPGYIKERRYSLRIWSAACSSGQEPYSLSMTVHEFNHARAGELALRAQIDATDISTEILASAKSGIYDRLSICRGLSQDRLQLYFSSTNDGHWQIKPNIKEAVNFRSLNLQSDSFGASNYDLIFCRNVLIYFNAELKQKILRRMHAVLAPGGLLFMGASEGVNGVDELFSVVNCQPGIAYRKR